jgi:hypothetical protein
VEISERKKSIVGILGNVAELGAARVEKKIGKATLRDATIGTGVAVDKLLALTGRSPGVQVVVVNMPSAQEREERRALDQKLCAIAERLKHLPPTPVALPPSEQT